MLLKEFVSSKLFLEISSGKRRLVSCSSAIADIREDLRVCLNSESTALKKNVTTRKCKVLFLSTMNAPQNMLAFGRFLLPSLHLILM